jgi:hypothetical protein
MNRSEENAVLIEENLILRVPAGNPPALIGESAVEERPEGGAVNRT